MADIATLGIEVTTKGVAQAERDLAKLTQTGATAEKQVAKVAPAMDTVAKSAKELQFATRGLPAQFTDIVSSLASGQRPLQVLFQQGGQLKDMFGGAGLAARSLGAYVVGLINPLTLTAGAVVGLAAAWEKSQEQAVAFNRALIMTGGYAGRTSEQLQLLADKFDAIAGVTAVGAAEIIASVAASGQFSGQIFDQVAEAAVRASEAGVKSADDVVKAFAAIGKDPVDALLKLNIAEHFLTATQIERVKALQDEGREQDAVRIASTIYFDTLRVRSAQAREQVTTLAGLWRSFSGAVRQGFSDLVNAPVLDTASKAAEHNIRGAADQLRTISKNLQADIDAGEHVSAARVAAATARIAQLQRIVAQSKQVLGASKPAHSVAEETVDSTKELAREAKQKQFEAAGLRYLDDQARKKQEIADVQKLVTDGVIKQEQAEKRIGEINAFHARKAPKGPKPHKLTSTEDGTTLLDQIRQQIALNEQEAKTQDSLTASERLGVTARQQLGKVLGTISVARKKDIEVALVALETSGKQAEALKAEKKANEDLARLKEQLAVGELNQRRASELDLMGIGHGRDRVDQLRRELDLRREYEDGLAEIRRNSKDKSKEALDAEETALRESFARRLGIEQQYQAQRIAEMGKWQNGARAAIEDYLASAADVASQTADIVGNAFSGLENTLVDFFTKGKADWRGYLDSIAADITRFVVRQQLAKLAEKFLPGLTGGGDDHGAAALSKSAGELAASGGTLLGAAAALGASAAALAAAGLASAAGGAASSSGSLSGFGNLISSFMNSGGYASGGYTGPGGAHQPAGLVHRGEVVFSQADVARNGGVGAVERMRTGGGGGHSFAQTVNVVVEGRITRQTPSQIAKETGREAARALGRN